VRIRFLASIFVGAFLCAAAGTQQSSAGAQQSAAGAQQSSVDRQSGGQDTRTCCVAILDLNARKGKKNAEAGALKHCLDILGIRNVTTGDVEEAILYRFVCTAGSLWNDTLTVKEFSRLSSWVETGGTLLSSSDCGNKYWYLFGIGEADNRQDRFTIRFASPETDDALKYLDRKEEREVSLGRKDLYRETIWTQSFGVKGATVLAKTEDGMAVFSVNSFGKGLSYALGVSFRETVLLPQIGGDFEAQRAWANTFEPGADVFCLILKGIFEQTFEPYVYLGTIPNGERTAFLLSHDIDAQTSFKNSVDFAALEKRYGVRSTFFINTKYFSDEKDIGYYDKNGIAFLKKVMELGGDIGSHSVSHSSLFNEFASGDAAERLETYAPLTAPSVFGEVVVSKQLLDRDLPGQKTLAFRSGELRIPRELGAILEKSGYRYDSSYSANDTMTNFAYRMMKGRSADSGESSIVEIPVTFDDSQGLLTAKNSDSVFRQWLDVIWANADNEAISVMLIHPTETGFKLKMEERLLTELRGKDVWVGDISTYGAFWNARAKLRYSVRTKAGRLSILIESGIPVGGPPLGGLPVGGPHVGGLCFAVGKSAKLTAIEIIGPDGIALDYVRTTRGDKTFISLQ